MRSNLHRLLCATAVSMLGGTALAVPSSTELKENYQSIIERNPFGLHPPPEPKPATNTIEKPAPKQKIFLTGITSIGYPRIPKYAYLKTEEEGKKEPNFYSLQEEQSKDGITILQIDDKNKKVKIRTPDGERVLSFATDGIAAPVGPGAQPGGVPGAIPLPGQPGAMPHPINTAATPQPINQNYNAASTQAAGNYAANAMSSRIPSRNVRVRGGDNYGSPTPTVNPIGGTPQHGQQQEQPIDPATQYLMLKAQEQNNIQQGIPTPPIPPLE